MQQTDWKIEFNRIRKILNDWDPIGDTPADEYDDFAFGIQSRIQKHETDSELINFMRDYLHNHIGLQISESEIIRVFKQILK